MIIPNRESLGSNNNDVGLTVYFEIENPLRMKILMIVTVPFVLRSVNKHSDKVLISLPRSVLA